MNPDEMKARSRGQSVDMSPGAIAHRINIVSELRAAMIALERARPVATPSPQPEPRSRQGGGDPETPDARGPSPGG